MPKNKLTITPKYPRGDDGYRTLSIRVKKEIIEDIDEISKKTERSRNELIGTLLEYAINNSEVVVDEEWNSTDKKSR